MADNNNNNGSDGEGHRKTDSNLPILFANGYPISLEKMTSEQLERFIPFLVDCSRNGEDENDVSKPKWWPSSLEFKMPLERPKNFRKNWRETLSNIVEECYKFHNQPFLLKYSSDLTAYEPENLRYVRAGDATTSLFSRNPKKLLLTFRNENMLYDKKKRMTLWKKDDTPSPTPEQEELESTFDIILCDYCDAEFYSDEAYKKHENECGNSAEQEEREQEAPVIDNIVISDDEDELDETDEVINGQTDFMAYFFLASSTADELPRRNNSLLERSISPKKKRPAQRTRKVIVKKEKDLEMTIPFSSPAGLVLTKKNVATEQHVEESFEFMEAYCPAKPTIRIVPRVKQRLITGSETAVIKEMRKPRIYYWPKRHLHSQSREDNFEFLNRSLIKNVHPCSVVIPKISDNEMKAIQEELAATRALKKRSEDCVDLCSDSDGDSVTLDDGVEMDSFADQLNFQEDFFAMPCPSMMPPEIPPLQQFSTHPLPSNEVVIFNRSQSYSTSSIGSQHFPQFTFTNARTTTNIVNRMKRSSEGDVYEASSTKRSIKQWIENVTAEYTVSSHVSVVNGN